MNHPRTPIAQHPGVHSIGQSGWPPVLSAWHAEVIGSYIPACHHWLQSDTNGYGLRSTVQDVFALALSGRFATALILAVFYLPTNVAEPEQMALSFYVHADQSYVAPWIEQPTIIIFLFVIYNKYYLGYCCCMLTVQFKFNSYYFTHHCGGLICY